jgi:hypothetical protein
MVVFDGARLPRPVDCHFLNVLNASPEKAVQVTHVWVESPMGAHVSVLAKPLPVVVEPGREWETWIETAHVPAGVVVEASAFVRLSDGSVIGSEARVDVPPAGAVPDG